jgi:DNA-binding transcriptional LysR family regulator
MELQRVDLNLLVAFDALMDERSVTGAAQRLAVSQSAMSATLARLRKLFDDPVLVRDGRAMLATPLAEALVAPVRAALGQIEQSLTAYRSFDPEVDERTFVIMASGHAAVGLLHPLLAEMTTTMPNLRIEIESVAEDFAVNLLRGQVDMVLLPLEFMSSHQEIWSDAVHREVLYRDRYVLAACRNNDRVTGAMTIDDFGRMPYLAAVGTDGSASLADVNLDVLGLRRRVVCSAGFAVAPFVLRDTDLITLVPRIPAALVAAAAGIRLVEPPMQLQPISETMAWLRRMDHDPGHAWLRERLRTQARPMLGSTPALG